MVLLYVQLIDSIEYHLLNYIYFRAGTEGPKGREQVVTWQATSRGVAVKDFKGPDKHNVVLGLLI